MPALPDLDVTILRLRRMWLRRHSALNFARGLLQSLFGYDALSAGFVMSPAGFFAVLAMPVIAFILVRKTDARWLIGAGLLLMTISNY